MRRTAVLGSCAALHALAIVVIALFAASARASTSASTTLAFARASAAHEIAFVAAPCVRHERAAFRATPPFVALPASAAPFVDEAVASRARSSFVSSSRVLRDLALGVVSARGPPLVV